MFEDESVVSLAPTAITFLAEASLVMVPSLPEGKPPFPAAKKMAVSCQQGGEEGDQKEGLTMLL
jgi:hypothetical protein